MCESTDHEWLELGADDHDVAGGAGVSGLTGKVSLRSDTLRSLHVFDSPELLALDLWGCGSDLLLDLDCVSSVQEVFLPERGEGVHVHISMNGQWQPIRLFGKVLSLSLEISNVGGGSIPAGLHHFDCADGVALLTDEVLQPIGNIERYIRIDQHARGLQFKELRADHTTPNCILWRLARPCRPEGDSSSALCQSVASSQKLDQARFEALAMQHDDAWPESSCWALRHSRRLANRGMDIRPLWNARCILNASQPDAPSVGVDSSGSGLEWPAIRPGFRARRIRQLNRDDLLLFLLVLESSARKGDIEDEQIPAIDEIHQLCELSEFMRACLCDGSLHRAGLRHWMLRWLADALDRTLRRSDSLQQQQVGASETLRSRTTGLVRRGDLRSLLHHVVEIGDAKCIERAIALVTGQMGRDDCLETGIWLVANGHSQGRALIFRGLRAGEPLRKRQRARAMRMLLQPAGRADARLRNSEASRSSS